jgi:antitoxin (DNA-binding transcriptional repressor) of toxin-antitoxin stability system
MRKIHTVNIHEAKTHLSKLIERAVRGEPFIIAKAGKPLVEVKAIPARRHKVQRLGCMQGEIIVPEDFDKLGKEEIEDLFGSDS